MIIILKNGMYPKKWKINKEDLQKFTSSLSKSRSNLTQPNNINNVADDFTSRIYDAAIVVQRKDLVAREVIESRFAGGPRSVVQQLRRRDLLKDG